MGVTVTPIPDSFLPYVDAAVVRFMYLYPSITIERSGSTVHLSGEGYDAVQIKQDFLHLIYREKIYAETLDLRKALFRDLS